MKNNDIYSQWLGLEKTNNQKKQKKTPKLLGLDLWHELIKTYLALFFTIILGLFATLLVVGTIVLLFQ